MELFIDLGLKEIAAIIGRMGLTTDINDISGEVELNGVKYNYNKNGNELVVNDSLGNTTKVRINYQEETKKDVFNRNIRYVTHEVSIDYLLPNGEFINLSNQIPLEPGSESFENVHRHDILSGLRTKYCDKTGKEIASFGLDLNKICLKDNNQIYEFDKNGIICGKKLITLDGNTLVSISGSEIPSVDVINSFNLKEEQEKLKEIINENSNLHPFTIEIVEDSIRKLERKERYVKDIVDYYNTDIKNARKVIEIRNLLINEVKNHIVDKDGLEMVEDDFYKKTANRVKRKIYY